MLLKGFAAVITSIALLIPSAIQSQIVIKQSSPLPPAQVDNSKKQFFPPIIEQLGESCGNANGTGYTFAYETNCARALSATPTQNQYPYWFTYAFLNGGADSIGTSHMYIDVFQIAQENGIPSIADCSNFTASMPTRWLSGYDYYYKAMFNRTDKIDSIDMLGSSGLSTLKQWLYDHGNGSSSGGVANFSCFVFNWRFEKIASTYGSGKSVVMNFAPQNGDHAQTVVGYDDSIRVDFNGDGKFTNNLDITGDGKVTMADGEIGALIVANSWGTVFGDNGFYYLPYRLLALTPAQGGIENDRMFIMTPKTAYVPRMTFKAGLTHQQRNQIALSVGVAPDPLATAPTHSRPFKQFTYAGGPLPMCGAGATSAIEIGLDISDLIDSIPGAKSVVLFLIVDAKSAMGTVNSLSLMDYTSGNLAETPAAQVNVALPAGRTLIRIPTTIKAGIRSNISSLSSINNVLQIRRTNRVFEIYAPFKGMQRIDIFSMNGTLISQGDLAQPGWHSLPAIGRRGICIVKVRSASGKTIAGTAVIAE
jgi:hypothetical protein